MTVQRVGLSWRIGCSAPDLLHSLLNINSEGVRLAEGGGGDLESAFKVIPRLRPSSPCTVPTISVTQAERKRKNE